MNSTDTTKSTDAKQFDEDHPEQDPAEGSREVINNDLAETGGDKAKTGTGEQGDKPSGAS